MPCEQNASCTSEGRAEKLHVFRPKLGSSVELFPSTVSYNCRLHDGIFRMTGYVEALQSATSGFFKPRVGFEGPCAVQCSRLAFTFQWPSMYGVTA